jgi:hypothetical protein
MGFQNPLFLTIDWNVFSLLMPSSHAIFSCIFVSWLTSYLCTILKWMGPQKWLTKSLNDISAPTVPTISLTHFLLLAEFTYRISTNAQLNTMPFFACTSMHPDFDPFLES